MNTPDVTTVLRVVADLIGAEHPVAAPGEAAGYGAQQLMRAPMMLQAIAAEHDRAAHWRVQENTALRDLFVLADKVVGDPDLRERLKMAAGTRDTDLHISSLDRSNQRLRALLIDLHVWVQNAADNSAANESHDLEARIWRELRLSTERRRSALDRF